MRRQPAVVVAAVAVIACGAAKSAPSGGETALAVQPLSSAVAAKRAADAAQAPARSHLIATIARKAIGPFAARTAEGGVVAWIVAPDRGGGQDLVVVPVAADGAPLGAPRVVASVPREATSLIVRPTHSPRGGWLLAWSALLDRGESLTVLGLAPDGTTRGPPADVQRTSDHFKWLDLVSTGRGSLCVWAEETTGGEANLLAAPIDSDGKPRGMPVRIAQGVERWQVAPADEGVVLALVGRADRNRAATLSWARLDVDGRLLSPITAVSTKPTVSGDVDIVPMAGGWLLAWTDRAGEDAQVMFATVDGSGRVQGPRPAMSTVGGSAMVALASGAVGAALAWEEPRARQRERRVIHLASIANEGGPMAHPVSSLDIASRDAPEFVAAGRGFALLTSAHECDATSPSRPCDGSITPTFVRFDERLAPAQAEPLFLGDDHASAALAWGLRCEGERCLVLSATGETPTPVFAVDLQPRASPFAAPLLPPPPADAPRVTGIATIASGLPYTDVVAARAGDTTLVATLTSSVEAPRARDRASEGGATISLRAVDGEIGKAQGATSVLTTRALPVGGVAVSAGDRAEDGAAVAWIARDSGGPQVHVARVDRRGHRTNEVQLTTAKGGATDVAVAWAGDGWLVAWIDSRDGNGDVYATKVDRDLHRTAREERITKAPGDAGDLSIAVRGETAWLAWSDPRESPGEGLADVYARVLSTRDARPAGDEVCVLATAAHSRSPKLALAGDGAVVAWIEDAPTGLDGPGTAMAARLGVDGRVVSVPAPLALAGDGRPTTIALAATATGVHAVVSRVDHDETALDALALSADATGAMKPCKILDLDAPQSFDVALSLAGDGLFFDDVGASMYDHRVRHATIAWRR